MSSNRLDKTSCPHLRDMLRMSSKLENLNVACNQLGQDGGKILLEGVKMSRAIKRVSSTELFRFHFIHLIIYPHQKFSLSKPKCIHIFRLMFDSLVVEETLICQFKKYYVRINQWAMDTKELHEFWQLTHASHYSLNRMT